MRATSLAQYNMQCEMLCCVYDDHIEENIEFDSYENDNSWNYKFKFIIHFVKYHSQIWLRDEKLKTVMFVNVI